jgi:cbb3-type cytochrome oxidase subunit 1
MDVTKIEEVVELTQPMLDKLSKAIEGGARFSYQILLRQQYVRVAQVGLGWVFFVLFIAIPTLKMRKIAKEQEKEKEYAEDWIVAITAFLVAVGIVFLIILVISSFEAIGILINPDYYVLKEVSDLLLRN